MPWTLFPQPEPDDPNARYTITWTAWHPAYRPHMLGATTTKVRGTRQKRETVAAITGSGGRISEIRQHGRWFR